MTLDMLNAADRETATHAFLACCGSIEWARQMAGARPFADTNAVTQAGDSIWTSLRPADWLEAFAAHPRIGSGRPGGSGKAGGARESGWSRHEQAGVRSAAEEVLQRLANGNQEYEARFGYIFIVNATGKSAREMLAILERRLGNDPASELIVAAAEQRAIIHLRLAKLLAHHDEPTP